MNINKNYVIALAIVGLALGMVLYQLSGDYKITNLPSKNISIVAFGDSLVEGVGSTDSQDFISLLSAKTGRQIVNLGKSGDTTSSALTRLQDVVALKPKVTIILLGGNDFIRRVEREVTFTNLRTIISEIQKTGSVTVLLGVRSGVFGGSADRDYEKLAKETGSLYVPDVLDGIFSKREYMSDAIHPNNAGYKIIAEKVYPVLIKGLK